MTQCATLNAKASFRECSRVIPGAGFCRIHHRQTIFPALLKNLEIATIWKITTIIITAVQNHQRMLKSVDRSVTRAIIFTYSYKMLANYNQRRVGELARTTLTR